MTARPGWRRRSAPIPAAPRRPVSRPLKAERFTYMPSQCRMTISDCRRRPDDTRPGALGAERQYENGDPRTPPTVTSRVAGTHQRVLLGESL
jgi:hypothetical protein